MSTYTDLLIRISTRNATTDGYPVEARINDGSFYGGGQFQLDNAQLLALSASPAEYGKYLFETLFAGPIGRAYERAVTLAEAHTQGRLRFRLWLESNVAELQAIRWERLQHHYQGNRASIPVSISSLTPFSRYIELEMPEAPPLTVQPLQLLIVISNPVGLPDGFVPVNVEFEVENLYQALDQVNQFSKTVQVTLLPGRTGISTKLATKVKKRGWEVVKGEANLDTIGRNAIGKHILHFVGHGKFQRRNNERGESQTVLYLEQAETGAWDSVSDSDIVSRLVSLTPLPQLIFLVACETGTPDDGKGHPFVGLGPKLVQIGVPAVVAMQDLVPIATAQRLTADFYRLLQKHGVIDLALNQARTFIYDQNNSNSWDVPALFMRSETGLLLTPDPLRTTLEAIYNYKDFNFFDPANKKYLPLPIEVVHLTQDQQFTRRNFMMSEGTASVDLIQVSFDLWADYHERQSQLPKRGRRRPLLLVLLGDHGCNKSTQMKHLVWQTVNASLQADRPYVVLPIYVDLPSSNAARLSSSNLLETWLFNSLATYWVGLTEDKFDALLADKSAVTLRIFLANSDQLGERERFSVWQQLADFMRNYSHHEYIIDQNTDLFNPENFEAIELHVLKMQLLDPRKICHFLDNRANTDPASGELLRCLQKRELLDLATIPWFMVDMVRRAKLGDFPDSRTEVLQRIVDDALTKIPQGSGMRLHADKVLQQVSWNMYNERQTSWPLTQVFDIMMEVRGHRAYNLETFYEALLDSGLVAEVGEENLRFTYMPVQSFCAAKAIVAMPNYERVLDDVTARFGRLKWLRWGKDTMIFVSGLFAANSEALIQLLQVIVYGVDLLTSEQTFLATYCLLEANSERERLAMTDPLLDEDMIDQVINALIWRLDSQHETRLMYRLESARLLGQRAKSAVVPHLAEVAIAPMRLDLKGQYDYEFGSMRMAALTALQNIAVEAPDAVAELDKGLAQLLQWWQEKKVNELVVYLHDDAESLRGVAALMLGDLQPQLQSMPEHRVEAFLILEHLVDAFFDTHTMEVTLWAITHALALLDTLIVTDMVVKPALTDHVADATLQRDKCLAYLIGRIRAQDPAARTFLVQHCLQSSNDMRLSATAIEALGWLANPQDKSILELIACGQLSHINKNYVFPPAEEIYLRQRAIESLSYMGDLVTITKLQNSKTHWVPDLRRVFYRTSEEIYWRLNQMRKTKLIH